MNASPLGQLPPELRNLVYEYALTEPKAVHIQDVPGLLNTCRTIRAEAELMFYAINDFTVRIRKETRSHVVCRWLKLRSGTRVPFVRRLLVRCEMPRVTEYTESTMTREEFQESTRQAWLHLMHVVAVLRRATFAIDLVQAVHFTLNDAKDNEPLDSNGDREPADRDWHHWAKFLIMSLLHGERAVMGAWRQLRKRGSTKRLAKLYAEVQNRRKGVSESFRSLES